MSQEIRNLEPKVMWSYFADLNEVPRPSKQEERVIAFIKKFGQSLNLPTYEDEVGNVIIKKPASKGMESRTTVVLQSHLDMVCQKNSDTDFDFNTEGIKMYVDGDWVKAKGTTLGSDNGIGVASIMALLASNDIPHPPLEGLFTIDEETGMTGAMGLKGGLLDAKIMLNLDTEDDDELTIGCAGGIDINVSGTYPVESAGEDTVAYKLSVTGLSGGHSGMDIHKGLGNANKIINRLLSETDEKFHLRISMIDGGGLRNAIPRESFAEILVTNERSALFEQYIAEQSGILNAEYAVTDLNLKIGIEKIEKPNKVLPLRYQQSLVRSIYACPNGIYRMSPDIKDLVQTSNNLARVLVKDGEISILSLTRGSVDSEKMDLSTAIKSTFELGEYTVDFSGEYPGWAPKPNAGIVKLMSELYQEMFKEEAHVSACHAGLECGILGTNYPQIEMISFGPNIRGAHSPDEKVQISSVQKYWSLLLETLKRIE